MNITAQKIRFFCYFVVLTLIVRSAALGNFELCLYTVAFALFAIFFERERTAMEYRYGHYKYFKAWWKEFRK